MKRAPHHGRSGIALVIVMITVMALSILTAAFAFMMKVETKLSHNSSSEERLKEIGLSTLNTVEYVLAEQLRDTKHPYDAPPQIWTGGEGEMDESNEVAVVAPQTLDQIVNKYLGAGEHVSVKIVDLESFINVNTVDEVTLRRAFTVMGADPGDVDVAADSILDWMDPDSDPHPNGAENDYYQGLNPPYFAKNGPIDDLSELLLVKGVTSEMYWGPDAANHAPAAFQNAPGLGGLSKEPPTYICGLVDLFKPMGTGRVNVDTASALVLQAVGFDPDIANGIVTLRGQAPIQNVGELINVPGMTAQMLQAATPYLDVHSHTFEVTIDATIGGYSRRFIAIVGRNNLQDIQVLSFRWE